MRLAGRGLRCVRGGREVFAALDFDANASRSTQHQQIEFRALVGGPKIGLIRFDRV